VFPLYEVENGKYRLSFNPESLRPVTDYFKGQGRFRHLTDEYVEIIQKRTSKEWEDLKSLCGVS
jgi:pyruvate ferredoxin oxidoreductase beta subunit